MNRTGLCVIDLMIKIHREITTTRFQDDVQIQKRLASKSLIASLLYPPQEGQFLHKHVVHWCLLYDPQSGHVRYICLH